MSDRDPAIQPPDIDWGARRSAAGARTTARLLDHLAAKTTDRAPGPMALPKEVYIDEARFEAEREKLFMGEPIVAGLSGDVPQPGDVLLFDAAGPSILVMRGKDGAVRAFLNMCTHRGAKLIEESEGFAAHKSRLTCPFHAWTFDTRGKIVGQPSKANFADCAIGARDLVELPCLEHLGLIFVRPGGGSPIDAEAHLGTFADVLALIELHRAVPVKKGVLTAEANWKFALDTYGESYHFATLHATTIGQTHYSDIAAYTPFGRHYHISFPHKGMADKVGKPRDEWGATEYGGVHYLFPNTIIFFGAIVPGVYFTQLFRLFPDGVGKTRVQFAVYAPFGILSDEYRQTCVAAWDATAEVVQTEDFRISAAGFANLKTAPAGFQTVLGANEAALQDFQRNVAAAIGMPIEGARA